MNGSIDAPSDSFSLQEYPYYDLDIKFSVYETSEDCLKQLGASAYAPQESNDLYCNGTFDGVLCWPAAPVMTTARQHCPPLPNLLTHMYGKRRCGPLGLWEGRKPGDLSMPNGWTDYMDCYSDEMRQLYNELFSKESSELLKKIAVACKRMEMIGLTLSLFSLLLSIFIFCYFRGLRCHRTRIHRNLFVAISIHITIQLVVNIDEIIGQSTGSEVAGSTLDKIGMINNTPVLCEIMKAVVIEYTKTVMFMWMFIEGMYLHNTLVISVFSGKPNYVLYYCLGWGFPFCLTLIWAVPTSVFDKNECWFGYQFRALFWLIEGPRALIILINLLFLLNIIRVLVTKLQNSNSTEALKVRKAVKAAIVLLPLLGVNNALALVKAPTDDGVKFAVFQVVYVFLISFQGFFIALLYCFLNGEVQHTVKRHWITPYGLPSAQPNAANSYVRRTLSIKWDRFMLKRGYRQTAKRRSDVTSSTPLHDTVICAEMNGVALGKIADVKPNNMDASAPAIKRRESSDSGYEQDDSMKTEHVALMNGGRELSVLNHAAQSADPDKTPADKITITVEL